MGYHEAFDVLAGRIDLATAKAERDASPHLGYARRQRTWFRSEPGIRLALGGTGRRPERLARPKWPR